MVAPSRSLSHLLHGVTPSSGRGYRYREKWPFPRSLSSSASGGLAEGDVDEEAAAAADDDDEDVLEEAPGEEATPSSTDWSTLDLTDLGGGSLNPSSSLSLYSSSNRLFLFWTKTS